MKPPTTSDARCCISVVTCVWVSSVKLALVCPRIPESVFGSTPLVSAWGAKEIPPRAGEMSRSDKRGASADEAMPQICDHGMHFPLLLPFSLYPSDRDGQGASVISAEAPNVQRRLPVSYRSRFHNTIAEKERHFNR